MLMRATTTASTAPAGTGWVTVTALLLAASTQPAHDPRMGPLHPRQVPVFDAVGWALLAATLATTEKR